MKQEDAMSDTPPAEPAPAEPAPPTPEPELGEAGKKAIADERKARRDAEKRLTEQTKELERLREASMSDQEKAVAVARSEARLEAFQEVGIARVDDAVRVAAAGRTVDVDALLDGLDRTRFLNAEGQPDADEIGKWVDRISPAQDPSDSPFPDLGQGVRRSDALALNGDPLERDLKEKLGIR